MLEWLWPYMFALLPLPLLIRWLLAPARGGHSAILIPFFARLQTLNSERQSPSRWRWGACLLSFLIWGLLVSASARPVWIGEPVSIPVSGRDLMLAVDISGSMRETDMLVNGQYMTRIDAVKVVVSDFIDRRRGDRIGLILFGQRGYVQTPLTFDRNTAMIQLTEALPGFAGKATAIGDAIGLSINTLRDRPAESRVLILLTDGANTAGSDPRAAADIAAEAKIRIHTIGVGAERKVERDIFGNNQVTNPSRDLDEGTLTYIADKTGGQYFRARNPKEMQTIYSFINELEPVPEETSFRPQRSLFHWPLGLALVGAVLLGFIHRFYAERLTL